MHRKLPCLLMLLFFCVASAIQAQSTITFTGGTLENSEMSLSFSAGEAVSGSLSSSSILLTAGFSNGSDLIPVSNENIGNELPKVFRLKQNYPNPFNPSTIIAYDLPEQANVQLEVFNSIGAKVATLVQEQKSAGSHHIRFDASLLASGMYLYRLAANGKTIATKKMLLIK